MIEVSQIVFLRCAIDFFFSIVLLAGGHRAGRHGGSQRGGSAVHPSRLLKTHWHLSVHRSAGESCTTQATQIYVCFELLLHFKACF